MIRGVWCGERRDLGSSKRLAGSAESTLVANYVSLTIPCSFPQRKN